MYNINQRFRRQIHAADKERKVKIQVRNKKYHVKAFNLLYYSTETVRLRGIVFFTINRFALKKMGRDF